MGGGAGGGAGEHHHRADAGTQPGQREDVHGVPGDFDAGQARCLGVAAHGHGPAAEGGAVQQEPACDGHQNEDPHDHRQSEDGAAECAGEPGYVHDLGLPTRDHFGEAAGRHQHGQGSDEGHDFPVGDDDAVHQPGAGADGQGSEHQQQPVHVIGQGLGAQGGGPHRGQPHHGTHREVNAACGNDEGDADADHPNDGSLAENRGQVRHAQEAVAAGHGANHDQRDQRHHQAEAVPQAQLEPARPLLLGARRAQIALDVGCGAHERAPSITRSSTRCSSN